MRQWIVGIVRAAAAGIGSFGLDPKRSLVIASNANWPTATDKDRAGRREALYHAAQAAVDAKDGASR